MSISISPTEPIEVFFSYAHKDEELKNELVKHLSILKHQGVITAWHDREITAGTEWAGEIDTHLNVARVILLLISSDFLASDYSFAINLINHYLMKYHLRYTLVKLLLYKDYSLSIQFFRFGTLMPDTSR